MCFGKIAIKKRFYELKTKISKCVSRIGKKYELNINEFGAFTVLIC